ncbi:hypothetical protein [Lentilactobacillus sp. Marseille-Q4993]|uniref:hypothetical protein n=1 Tax=Lentilactobacillus sp. Marseille-Q4993 TaxID=3039492 RepID=UPI0024BCB181|nr:hypothetical protein [Lentilactobacillus sp. Marseille-Q4993]
MEDENLAWLLSQLKELESQQVSFVNKSILRQAGKIASEQSKRIEQAEGELDGRMWNPGKW